MKKLLSLIILLFLTSLSFAGNSDFSLPGSGGGGTPGGSNKQVQYNNSGAFGASSHLTWDNASNQLTVGITSDATISTFRVEGPANINYSQQIREGLDGAPTEGLGGGDAAIYTALDSENTAKAPVYLSAARDGDVQIFGVASIDPNAWNYFAGPTGIGNYFNDVGHTFISDFDVRGNAMISGAIKDTSGVDSLVPSARQGYDENDIQVFEYTSNLFTMSNAKVESLAGTGVRCVHTDATGNISATSSDCNAGTGGTGTVTNVSVVTANGFSGSVATATTTPAITLNNINWAVAIPVPSQGVNWNDINGFGTINNTAINWSNINGAARINSGGVNWQNINGVSPINVGGINWPSISNYATAKVVTGTSGGGVNWAYPQKVIGTPGSGSGYLDPQTVTPDYVGQLAVATSYTVPLLYAAGSTSTGDWYQPFNFVSGIASIGNSVYPETNADIQQITWQVNASVPSLFRTGDSAVTIGNRSSSPFNSGAGVCVQNMTVNSKGLATESSNNSVVASCMNQVPKNRIQGLIPGYSMFVFNADSNDNKGLAIASPGLSGIDSGNYSGLLIDFINRKTRIPLWTAGVYQPEDAGVIGTITLASGGSGYAVNDELNVIQSSNTTGKVLVSSVSGGVVTGITKSAVYPGRGYTAANGLSTSTGSLQTVVAHTAGTGYVVGDTIIVVQSGGASGTAYVLHVTAAGAVDSMAIGNNNLAYSVQNADGTGYHTATSVSTTGGTGTGLTVDITTTGSTGTGATVNITAVNAYADAWSVDPSNGNTYMAGNVGIGVAPVSGYPLAVAGVNVTTQLHNTNDTVGSFNSNSNNTLQLGIYNPSGSTVGGITATTYQGLFGMDYNKKVGTLSNSGTTAPGTPAYVNVIDDGTSSHNVDMTGHRIISTANDMVIQGDANFSDEIRYGGNRERNIHIFSDTMAGAGSSGSGAGFRVFAGAAAARASQTLSLQCATDGCFTTSLNIGGAITSPGASLPASYGTPVASGKILDVTGDTILRGGLNLTSATASTPAVFDASKNVISGSYSGNTTKVVTNTGTNTSGSLTKWDASGNLIAAAIIPGTLTDGKLCSYTASGTALNCTTTAGAGTVTSVGVSSTNSTLTIGSSPVTTSGTITADIDLSHANTWAGQQTFVAPVLGAATYTTLSGGNITANASSIITDTTTGLKIGTGTTQKLGFFNTTPIVKPTGNVCTAMTNLGLVSSCTESAGSVTVNSGTAGNLSYYSNTNVIDTLPSITNSGGTITLSASGSPTITVSGNEIDDGSTGFAQFIGPTQFTYASVSATYSVRAQDRYIDITSGTFTATLHSASGFVGLEHNFSNHGAGIVTVACSGGQTIDGSSTATIAAGGKLRVVATGGGGAGGTAWSSF